MFWKVCHFVALSHSALIFNCWVITSFIKYFYFQIKRKNWNRSSNGVWIVPFSPYIQRYHLLTRTQIIFSFCKYRSILHWFRVKLFHPFKCNNKNEIITQNDWIGRMGFENISRCNIRCECIQNSESGRLCCWCTKLFMDCSRFERTKWTKWVQAVHRLDFFEYAVFLLLICHLNSLRC